MQSPIIVRRNGNQFIPNAFLELVLKDHNKAWSAALVSTDGEAKEIMVSKGDGDGLDIGMIQDTMKSCPVDDIVFSFYASDKALNMDDINPYVLLKDGDDTKIIGFVTGDFPGFDNPTSSKPSAFFFAHNYLKPKFSSLWELTDGNLEKIVSQFDKANFKSDILGNASAFGVITLMAQDCTTTTFAKTDTASEYPWGWTSDNLGYATAAKEEVKPKAKGMFPSKSTVREKAPTSATAGAPEPAKSDPVTATAEALKVNALENYTQKEILPPESLSRKERSKWYKNRVGYLPQNWEDGKGVKIKVWVDPKGLIMTFNDVKRLGLKALPMMEKAKDTETEHIQHKLDNAPPAGEKSVTTERLPIMSPKAREALAKYNADPKVQKKIAANASVIEDPTHVQEIEAKFASFNAQMKQKDMSDYLKWGFDMFCDLVDENPEAAKNMLFAFRNIIAGQSARQAKKVEAQETTHVVAKEELKPERRGMFPKKAVA